MYKITIIFIAILFFTACSTPVENSTANSNAANSNSNSAVASNADSKMIPLEGVDPNQFNSNGSDVPVVNRPPSDQVPTAGPRPAPDNSQINTVMRSDGSVAETRTFKDHPDLVKVERITIGQKVSVKVYLKNGRVIDVAKEKLPEFHVIAPANILLAAGIKPQVPQQSNGAQKKSEKEPETAERP